MHYGPFEQILLLLALAVVLVGGFRRLDLPAILAYLLIGMLVGPHATGWVPDTDSTHYLAEFGVVFLLFTIGLEFSLPQLVAMKGVVLGLGGSQVVVSTALIASVAWLTGIDPAGAFVIGAALALSSTALVTKQLAEQVEINSRHGRAAVGVLLFQDVAVIPFLVIISTLGGIEDGVMGPLAAGLAKGALAVAALLAAGRWLLRPFFHEIAATRSSELFTLTALLVTLLAAWGTEQLGLSMALGAFLAGMMLGETEFRHQIEADIRPFRDVLLGLFFVTVGMLLDLHALLELWPIVLAVTAALITFKALLILFLALLGGMERGVALRTAVVLAQGGEFGFAMLSLALSRDLLSGQASQIVLASVIISFALAAFLVRYNGWIAKHVFARSYARSRRQMEEEIEEEIEQIDNHVIICGYGRVGQNLARFLDSENVPFIALDLDPVVIREARTAGDPVHYGDSTRPEILDAAGLNRARGLLVSFDDLTATLKILQHTRNARPDMPVLVRTRDDANLERLQRAGATEVVPETLEASLMLASHLLLLIDVPVARVLRYMRDIRTDRYSLLRGFFHGQEPEPLETGDRFRKRLHTLPLPNGARAIGRRIDELGIDDADVEVTAVRRGGIRGPQPDPGTVLQEGDVLILYGTPEALERTEARVLKG